MTDEWKKERLEAEMVKHEKELLRKAHLKKLISASVEERVKYIIKNSDRKDWTAEDLHEELTKLQLDQGVTLADITNVLKK